MSDSRPNGVLTVWIATLPRPLSILVGVFLVLASLAALGAGARSLAVGTSFGRVRGTEEKQGWLQGGVGGIVCGSWAGALVSTFVLLLALSKQAKPALNRWAILAILIVPSLVGAVTGGRWRVGAVLSLSLTSSISMSLLLTCSAHFASLTPRLVLLGLSFLLIAPTTFWSRSKRFAIPAAAAFTGAYIFVLAVDVFARSGFVDAVGLLVSSQGVAASRASTAAEESKEVVVEWTTPRAKALVAGWWLLALSSGAWQFWWGLGTEGEETWDSYVATLPDEFGFPHRQGTYLGELPAAQRIRRAFGRKTGATPSLTELPQRSSFAPWDDEEETAALKRPSHPDSVLAWSPSTPVSIRTSRSFAAQSDADADADDLDLDLPELASQPAQYSAYQSDYAPPRAHPRPRSSLHSLPSYQTSYSSSPSFRSVEQANLPSTPSPLSSPRQAASFAAADSGATPHGRWPAALGRTIARVDRIFQRRPQRTAAVPPLMQPDQRFPGRMEPTDAQPERRPSLEDWWAQVAQKSEEAVM
ncbi:hypothetical protein JCM8202v2_004509 [Rhodotorula sphaerocarpa]